MKKLLVVTLMLFCLPVFAQEARTTIPLNGTWEFDQTLQAFPPKKFTRKIPVPGLIHLATPKIEDYDKFFKKPDAVEAKEEHNLMNLDYTPRYNWYRKKVFVPENLKNKEGVLTILKSQYVTNVYINGMEAGSSMECYTPIDFPITSFIQFGKENEILVRVGDRYWLPSQAAGSTDKEKEHYLPGIWDDVFLTFTGKIKTQRLLMLPDAKNGKVVAKMQVRSYYPPQMLYGAKMNDNINLKINILEDKSGKIVVTHDAKAEVKRDNITELQYEIILPNAQTWSPDKPFLYRAEVIIEENGVKSDTYSRKFGMRDFERKGKYFYLNDEKTILRGTNITLQRFFEDPDCGSLAWDREWVKKMLIDYSKQLNWNAMRICVGIVPDFWYDLADEYGLMFQNEWFYWQNHGWDDQIRKEYTDWVWSDGSHPSIVIWDAINENWDPFIGNVLISELMKLDPTRIWDAGYMTAEHMGLDEMDEPHPYMGPRPWITKEEFKKDPYNLGDLDQKPRSLIESINSSAAQLANEYGWIWLWRNGQPAKLTVGVYDYYLGPNATPQQRRELQAYWLQLETEWLRSERSFAGVLAFCHLTNNYGYTGDWFINNIKDLEPSPTLHWFQHVWQPSAVFINLPDGRYLHHIKPYEPNSKINFNLVGINDLPKDSEGQVNLKLLDETGNEICNHQSTVKIPAYLRTNLPVSIQLPEKSGGYLLVSEFTPNHSTEKIISRRYIKVGEADSYKYFDYQIDPVKVN